MRLLFGVSQILLCAGDGDGDKVDGLIRLSHRGNSS
jgi:hypothetical protein